MDQRSASSLMLMLKSGFVVQKPKNTKVVIEHQVLNRDYSAAYFEPRMATGSGRFSLLTCLVLETKHFKGLFLKN